MSDILQGRSGTSPGRRVKERGRRKATPGGRYRQDRHPASRRTTAASLVITLLLGLLAGVLPALTSAPAQAAPGDPFNSASPTVFISQGNPTRLYKAVTDGSGVTSFVTEGPTANFNYNAIAYNTTNNYIYALSVSAGTGSNGAAIPANALIRIGQNGYITRVGATTYTTGGTTVPFNTAAFGADGNLYAMTSDSTIMRVINPTTGALVRSITLSAVPNSPDFTYANGFFWGVNTTSGIVRINPTTGAVTSFPSAIPAGSYGGAWTYGNGNLGFSNNTTGTIYQVRVTNPAAATPTFTLVATQIGPASSSNDGTSSPGVPTDLQIVKDGPATFPAGGSVAYSLAVTNNGAGVSSGFVVTDTIPAPLTNPTTTSPGCTVSGQTVTCVSGTLAVGQTQNFAINATAPATMTSCVTNTATVLANETDSNPANNTDTAEGCVGPLVTCQTDASFFNTGYNAATGGVLANGALDGRWRVAGGVTGFNGPAGTIPANAVSLPPAGASFVRAQVGNQVPTAWAASPFGNAQWISANYTGVGGNQTLGANADWYYRYDFTLSTAVLPSSFKLKMNWFADNSVAGVWVNNVPQTGTNLPQAPGGSGPSIPLDPNDPYFYAGFRTAATASTLLDSNWQTGLNSIIVQIKSGAPSEGFLAQIQPQPVCPVPAITLDKSADKTGLVAGKAMTYSFTSVNTGNVTLTNVAITDPLPGLSTLTYTWPGTPGTLLAGQTVTATATYVVTQADVDAGTVSNTATVTGTPSTGPPVTATDSVQVPQAPAPLITLEKSADKTDLLAGETITYSFSSQNTGNVSLTNVAITDPLTGLSALTYTWPGTAGTLLPGQTVTATATYIVTQADVDNGTLTNTATATGTPPTGPAVTATDTLQIPPAPQWTMRKDAIVDGSPPHGTSVNPGETITYTVTATSLIGQIDGVVLTDDLSGVLDHASFVPGSAVLVVGPGSPTPAADPVAPSTTLTTVAFTLPAGQVATLQYQVVVKQDAWSKEFVNTVTGTATTAGPLSCAASTRPVDPGCTTTHRTPAKFLIQKIGESSDSTWVPMAGSSWAIHDDTGGAPGVADPAYQVEAIPTQTGMFQLKGIEPGVYWLEETTAPDGFSLLAEPVQLTIAPNGSVTLGQGGGAGVVTTGDEDGDGIFLITVRDVPALTMPESGSTGSLPFAMAGSTLLLTALVLAIASNRRRRNQPAASPKRQ
ncbi:putative repeat protein (TIGR01451 family) [Arthrobacter sp. 1088]|uniref:DUF6923 family protein n=1 Tax=Arthrobacter sp. 1088 TaxID=2817768 RepID=UPI00286073DD|nr:SpaA isopeptide-forming pilin-related protein [Arthrobacter sp. 1088]MDR6688321.1 putative repeat protein (TIGR01451 family) [Arthrobacter sp. 1088]